MVATGKHACEKPAINGFNLSRWILFGSFILSAGFIAAALHRWGAAEVRASSGDVTMLTIGGAAWLALASSLFAWLGLSARDDAVERRNCGASVALCGALLGIAATYAGGSLGEGPSYWNNFFSAALGTCGLFGAWWLMELGGGVSRSIAEERDLASGLRFGGFLVAVGVVLAREVAGDWHSASATVMDFLRDGWPVAGMCIIGIAIERWLRPNRANPFPDWRTCGLLPALAYIATAAAWLIHVGRWEGMPG